MSYYGYNFVEKGGFKFICLDDQSKYYGGRSITNAAESIVPDVMKYYDKATWPQVRIVYKDSTGNWDGLEATKDGKFARFIALYGIEVDDAIKKYLALEKQKNSYLGSSIEVFRNQAERDAVVIGETDELLLIAYQMPHGAIYLNQVSKEDPTGKYQAVSANKPSKRWAKAVAAFDPNDYFDQSPKSWVGGYSVKNY